MTRCRTHAKKEITIISNSTAQADYLSWDSLGLLTYCLSMPQTWDFYPKQIWKRGRSGRDKIYRMFNELIEHGHCIRIRKPNPKMVHLAGEVEYEIFDDPKDCLIRAIELSETERFIECKEDFKKYLRHPPFQDPEKTDPKNADPEKPEEIKPIKGENPIPEKTTTPTPPEDEGTLVKMVGGISRIDEARRQKRNHEAINQNKDPDRHYPCLDVLDISVSDKIRATKGYPEELVQKVVAHIKRPTFKPTTTLDAALFYFLKNPKHLTPTKEEIEKEKQAQLDAKNERIDKRIRKTEEIVAFLQRYARERGHSMHGTPIAANDRNHVEFRGRTPVKIYYSDAGFKTQIEKELRFYEPLDEENRAKILDYIKEME